MKRVTLGVVAAVFALAVVGLAQGQFDGVGRAKIKNEDLGAARKKAIEKAAIRALEEAIGTLTPQKVFIENRSLIKSKILKEKKEYIQKQYTLAEAVEGGVYRVTIRLLLDLEALERDLVEAGLMTPLSQRPGFMILVSEKKGEGEYISQWFANSSNPSGKSHSERVLEDFISAWGFRVVLPDDGAGLEGDVLKSALELNSSDLLSLGKARKADFLILGTARARASTGLRGEGYKVGAAKIKYKIVSIESGKVYAKISRRATIEMVESMEPLERALRKAGQLTKEELKGVLGEIHPEIGAGFPRIKVRLKGFRGYKEFNSVMNVLEEGVGGVRSVSILSLSPGEAFLEVRSTGDESTFIVDLLSIPFKGFSLKLVESPETDVINLVVKYR